VLDALVQRFGWQPVLEGDHPIALQKGEAAVTLEPGGQIELSGAPLASLHHTQDEINEHLAQLGAVCRELDIAFLGLGTQPKWSFGDIPWMPKGRYREMRAYLPGRGHLSLDMMTRTATVQANLDFSDEADMVRKFRLSVVLQPLVTALFANSPFIDGRPNGDLSYRARIWQHTDPDRCGLPLFVLEPGFGFEAYVDRALAVPLLFFYRDGHYLPAGGVPFGEFLAGRHPALPGVRPRLADWITHLSTLFFDVRLKHYLEMRGADAGTSAHLCALPALWKGLLYDERALEQAWDLVRDLDAASLTALHAQVPRAGLSAPLPGGRSVRELAHAVLETARAGLSRLAVRNAKGCDESVYLHPLFDITESGMPPAARWLEAYHGRWGQSVDPLFVEQEVESFFATCKE
ncbi:MAG: glutamate--cysteine ligase, partial [Magnetococcus sp. WYHC-3]